MTQINEPLIKSPTRDRCVREAMGALSEVMSADVEALFDQATAVVDALTDSLMFIPAERFDEECHVCEQPVRDHLVDGRHPTVTPNIHEIDAWRMREGDEWRPSEPVADRSRRCWAERCERPAAWELVLPGGVTGHEHYCNGHSLERGRPVAS